MRDFSVLLAEMSYMENQKPIYNLNANLTKFKFSTVGAVWPGNFDHMAPNIVAIWHHSFAIWQNNTYPRRTFCFLKTNKL